MAENTNPTVTDPAAEAAKAEAAKADAAKAEAAKVEAAKAETAKAEAAKAEAAKAEAAKADATKAEAAKAAGASPKGREAELEKSVTDLQFQNKVIREAAKTGAKDPDYFEFLAGKARGEQGDKFDLAKWAGELKTAKPELFAGVAAPATQPANTTTAAGSAASAERTSIEQQIEEAKKKGDVIAVLSLTSKLPPK